MTTLTVWDRESVPSGPAVARTKMPHANLMSMLTRRLQILVDPSQYERLERTAKARGVSVGAIVRIGIDQVCQTDPKGRRAALARFFEAEPVAFPNDPTELERELDEMLDAP